MRIDHDYLKKLLEAFQAAPGLTTNIHELASHGLDYESDQFWFHMQILEDQGLVQGAAKGGLGYSVALNGSPNIWATPLRLTAAGHDFLEALQNDTVWNTIQNKLPGAALGTLLSVAKELLIQAVRNSL